MKTIRKIQKFKLSDPSTQKSIEGQIYEWWAQENPTNVKLHFVSEVLAYAEYDEVTREVL